MPTCPQRHKPCTLICPHAANSCAMLHTLKYLCAMSCAMCRVLVCHVIMYSCDHVSCAMCHVSCTHVPHFMCRVSCVRHSCATFRVSCVMCHVTCVRHSCVSPHQDYGRAAASTWVLPSFSHPASTWVLPSFSHHSASISACPPPSRVAQGGAWLHTVATRVGLQDTKVEHGLGLTRGLRAQGRGCTHQGGKGSRAWELHED